MTTEQKAKSYDEIAKRAMTKLEEAKVFDYDDEQTAHVIRQTVYDIVPELKESDDEKIRKAIRTIILSSDAKQCQIVGVSQSDMFAWLEKQGEQKQKNTQKIIEWGFDPITGDMHFDNLTLKQAEELKNALFGEQKPADKIQLGKKYKCIASPRYSTFVKGLTYKPEDKFLCSLMNFCSDCFEPIEDGGKKPADKVEPKFHEGDMIIHKELGGDYIHNPHKIIQVDILDKKYRLEGGLVAHFGEQDDYELIEQKPAEEYNITGIGSKNAQGKLGEMIKNLKPNNKVLEQNHADKVEPKFKVGDKIIRKELGGDFIHNPHIIIQVDVLDKKYRLKDGLVAHFSEEDDWELVEQKPVEWSEEDEFELECILCHLREYLHEDAYRGYERWLKSLKDRVLPTQEWSDGDENRITNICEFLKGHLKLTDSAKVDAVKFLQSLRPHKQWKPSDEQLALLLAVVNEPNNAGSESCHLVLEEIYRQLKALS